METVFVSKRPTRTMENISKQTTLAKWFQNRKNIVLRFCRCCTVVFKCRTIFKNISKLQIIISCSFISNI
uniref:Uncharacterized protein n=1 Tax=Octopus bimaculoides TaxID=37653 RepID=A0A0L8H3L9_OCTBM